jgi:CHASE2 domain-containing sensor protein
MSTLRRGLPKWLELLLAAAPGLLIVLASWSSATSAGARFFLGILVGLSIVLLIAGLVTLIDGHVWRRQRRRLGHP